MFSTLDTIVAIATPPGRGGIGVVRLSGPDARSIAQRLIAHRDGLEPRHATLTFVRDTTAVRLKADTTCAADPSCVASGFSRTNAIDQVVATYFPAPHSYTGEDVVELSAHGSPPVLRAIVEAAIAEGTRLAEPGEFTLRAFLNGRIDLMQAEAVADLIDAVTPLQARAAFDQLHGTLTTAIGDLDARLFDLIARLEASVDFPEEGYHFVEPGALAEAIDEIVRRIDALLADARRGRLVREGLQIAIIGKPNVGKSSLFNALVGAARAIVTAVPGTTRDLVTETVDLDGLRVTLVDTAGLRDSDDLVESQGVERSRQAATVSDLILIVADGSRPLDPGEFDAISQNTDIKRLVVANKSDLPQAWRCDGAVTVSAATGSGLDALRRRLAEALDIELVADRPQITNTRHIALLRKAQEALGRARTAALADGRSLSEEFVLADLQLARAALEEITGKRTPDDVLAHIFERFCIGK
jgi:tRNA modification GTPase